MIEADGPGPVTAMGISKSGNLLRLAVKAPTLVLHDTEERRVSVAAAHHLPGNIPDARLYLFEGRGHLPIFTATAEFYEVLRRFVTTEEVGSRPSQFV